jgi:hypothetical protein
MDPFSTTVSAIALMEAAMHAFVAVNRFIRAVKDAPEKMRRLAIETRTVGGILQNLSTLYDSLQDESALSPWGEKLAASSAAVQMPYLEGVKETLGEIKLIFERAQKDYESGKKRDAIWRSLAAPLAEPRLDKLLQELSRHKETLTLAVSVDTMEKLIEVGRNFGNVNEKIDALTAVVVAKVEADKRIEIREEEEKVIEFFSQGTPDYQQDFLKNLAQRIDGTCLWLTQRSTAFRLWKTEQNSKLWIRMYTFPTLISLLFMVRENSQPMTDRLFLSRRHPWVRKDRLLQRGYSGSFKPSRRDHSRSLLLL